MGSRRGYRGIEESVILGTGASLDHPHSYVARRLRYAYREGRDVMSLRLSRAMARASVYGNSGLDANAGWTSVSDGISNAFSEILYFNMKESRGRATVGDMAVLLSEMKKNITPEMVRRKYESLAFMESGGERHVLGGAPVARGGGV